MRRVILIVFALLIGMAPLAHSAQPMDELKGPIEQVISILKDPQYAEAAQKDSQRQRIWEVILKVFDFSEIAKRALGRHYKNLTPQQKKEFTDVFTEFLGNLYIDKIQQKYKDEKVVFVSQKLKTKSKAVVNTEIAGDTGEIPVVYSMRLRTDTWRVYDVRIEGVSLVKNYRTQFRNILLKESPDQLIERLKKKIKLQEKEASKKD